jgi:hypothetical protein
MKGGRQVFGMCLEIIVDFLKLAILNPNSKALIALVQHNFRGVRIFVRSESLIAVRAELLFTLPKVHDRGLGALALQRSHRQVVVASDQLAKLAIVEPDSAALRAVVESDSPKLHLVQRDLAIGALTRHGNIVAVLFRVEQKTETPLFGPWTALRRISDQVDIFLLDQQILGAQIERQARAHDRER